MNKTKFDQTTYCCVLSKIDGQDLQSIQQIINLTNNCFHSNENIKIKWNQIMSIMMYDDVSTEQQCKDECKEPVDNQNLFLIVTLLVILLLTVFSNLLIILSMLWTNLLKSNITNMFIMSLAFSDFSIGITLIPIKVKVALNNMKFCDDTSLCKFYVTTDNALFSTSITNLLVIAIDRYIAINYPYAYQDIITRKNSKIIILLVWLYGGLWGLLSNINWNNIEKPAIIIDGFVCLTNQNSYYVSTVFILVYAVPVIVMGAIYSRIFYIAKKHAYVIAAYTVVSQLPQMEKIKTDSPNETMKKGQKFWKPVIRSCSKEALKQQERNRAGRYRKIVFKASKTVATVYGTFVLAWTPVCIISIILAMGGSLHLNSERKWFHVMFVELFPILSSMINPIIYGVMNKSYRKAFKYILFHKLPCLNCFPKMGKKPTENPRFKTNLWHATKSKSRQV